MKRLAAHLVDVADAALFGVLFVAVSTRIAAEVLLFAAKEAVRRNDSPSRGASRQAAKAPNWRVN